MSVKTDSKKKVTTKIQGVAVPINWSIPDNIITRFASNMVVQQLENEFRLSFFEIMPDIKLALAGKVPEEVQANCVASIIINAERLPIFIKALQKQYEIYNQIKANLNTNTTSSNEP